jgi:hypothetical protein
LESAKWSARVVPDVAAAGGLLAVCVREEIDNDGVANGGAGNEGDEDGLELHIVDFGVDRVEDWLVFC